MKSVLAKLEENRAHLEIEVPPADVEKALDRAYRKLARNILIPGFRKGKAPRPLVERRLGRQVLIDEAIEDLVPEAYLRAVNETGIEPIDRPEISELELKDDQTLSFKAVVTVKPEVELGDYKSIRVQKVPPAEVTDEDVDKVIEELRNEHAQLVAVEDDVKAEKGLFAIIDFQGSIDGRPFAGGTGENYLVEIGASRLLQEFEDQLVGMSIGEERRFVLTYPSDYANPELAGKTAEFAVKLKELKRKELPPLDDNFAQTVGSFATVAELRADVKNRLEQRAAADAEQKVQQEVIKAVVDGAEVAVPEILIERRIDQLVENYRRRLELQGIKLEDVMKEEDKTLEELRRQFRSAAEQDVKTDLVLEAIAKRENIQPDDDDLAAEAVRLAELYGQDIGEIRRLMERPDVRADLESSIRIRKTIDFLVASATAG